jgi:type VI secretion system protein VasD
MTVRLVATVGLLALSTITLAGCGKSDPPPPPPPPPVLELTVSGSADQNPGADGTPRPVAVHLYQLAATDKFTNADGFAWVENEQSTLGADELSSSEFVLKPSEKQEMKQDLKPGTKALGVAVWFYDINNAKWRASAPVAANGPTKLVLNVGKLSVSLEPAPSK